MLKKVFQNIRTRIPEAYRDEFIREINKENLIRMMIATIILIIFETLILIFIEDNIFYTDMDILGFIIFCAAMLTFMYFIYRRVATINKYWVRIFQFAYLLTILCLSCSLAVLPQSEFQNTHVYIITVFAIAAFIHIPPIENMILFLAVYLVFYLSIPYYQPNTDAVMALRINTFIMNIFAWILNRMVFRLLVKSFLDKKLILEKNVQLKNMSMRDSMTLLLNHEYVQNRLKEESERARYAKIPLSVIMLDIDDFKKVNDRYGHLTGDGILVRVAKTIEYTCRNTDIVGRYGGEEFIVIMPGTFIQAAEILAKRIRAAVEAVEFENGIRITISGGVAELHENDSAEQLIRNADKQLYKAKSNGKNRIEALSGVEGNGVSI